MIVYRLFLPAHYCYYSGLTVLKDFIHSFTIVSARYLFLNMNDYFGVCPLGGLNNKLVSVDPFNSHGPHGALKPQKTVFLNADLTLTHFDDVS